METAAVVERNIDWWVRIDRWYEQIGCYDDGNWTEDGH